MKSWNSEVLPVHASKIYNHITLLVVWQPQPQEHKCASLKYDSGQPSVVQKPLQQSEVTGTHYPPPSWGSSHRWKITSCNNGVVCDAFYMLAVIIFIVSDWLPRTFNCMFYFETDMMTKTSWKLCQLLRLQRFSQVLRRWEKKGRRLPLVLSGDYVAWYFSTHTNTGTQTHKNTCVLMITRAHCFQVLPVGYPGCSI